jgi:triacylglycerol lipase
MSTFYTKITQGIINGGAWLLDYSYVIYWQLYGFVRRAKSDIYLHQSKYGQLDKTPIILIPGIYENWRFMKPVADMLYQNGHPIHIVDGLGYNVGEVEAMALIIDTYIQSNGINECILVAHSKGGLIGKYMLAQYNSHEKIKGLIALNTPFSGSRYANILPIKSLRIFKPESPLLSLLTSNALINRNIVSIFGKFDPHIPGGSLLDGAKNIQLPTRGHFRIMHDTRVHNAIIHSLDYLTALSK